MVNSLGPLPALTFENTIFSLATDLPALLQAIRTSRCGALRLLTLSYRQVRLQLQQSLGAEFGKNSRQYLDLLVAPLHCAGCLWEFPDSYRNSLFLGQILQQEFGSVDGAVPGYRQIAETGLCPLCGCSECVLLYEYYPPDAIGQIELDAIRRYWQNQAREWWHLAESRNLNCADCDALILRNQGFLMNGMFLCAACVDQELSTALEKLRSYPHSLGNNLLRKARPYRE